MKLWRRREQPERTIPRMAPAADPTTCPEAGHYPTWPIAHRAARIEAVIKARRYTVARHPDRCWAATPATTPRETP